MIINIEILKKDKDVETPKYLTMGSSGMDIYSYIDTPEKQIVIQQGETKLIPTGIKVKIPYGFELQVRPRSGLSLKTNLRVANSPGTIDSDYRGEIGVIMTNLFTGNTSPKEIIIKHKERIAQLVVVPVFKANLIEVSVLDETERNVGGFGSTGDF